MIKIAAIVIAVVFALNGGLDNVPVSVISDDYRQVLHWLFGGLLAGLGIVVGPAVVEAIKASGESATHAP